MKESNFEDLTVNSVKTLIFLNDIAYYYNDLLFHIDDLISRLGFISNERCNEGFNNLIKYLVLKLIAILIENKSCKGYIFSDIEKRIFDFLCNKPNYLLKEAINVYFIMINKKLYNSSNISLFMSKNFHSLSKNKDIVKSTKKTKQKHKLTDDTKVNIRRSLIILSYSYSKCNDETEIFSFFSNSSCILEFFYDFYNNHIYKYISLECINYLWSTRPFLLKNIISIKILEDINSLEYNLLSFENKLNILQSFSIFLSSLTTKISNICLIASKSTTPIKKERESLIFSNRKCIASYQKSTIEVNNQTDINYISLFFDSLKSLIYKLLLDKHISIRQEAIKVVNLISLSSGLDKQLIIKSAFALLFDSDHYCRIKGNEIFMKIVSYSKSLFLDSINDCLIEAFNFITDRKCLITNKETFWDYISTQCSKVKFLSKLNDEFIVEIMRLIEKDFDSSIISKFLYSEMLTRLEYYKFLCCILGDFRYSTTDIIDTVKSFITNIFKNDYLSLKYRLKDEITDFKLITIDIRKIECLLLVYQFFNLGEVRVNSINRTLSIHELLLTQERSELYIGLHKISIKLFSNSKIDESLLIERLLNYYNNLKKLSKFEDDSKLFIDEVSHLYKSS